MIIDKKGKLFGKISIIDICIVLILVLCLGAAYMRFAGGMTDITAKNVTIEYTYEVKNIRMYTVEALERGGDIYKRSAGEDYMGMIVNVEHSANKDFVADVDGVYKTTGIPGRYDAIVTIQTQGKLMNSAIYTSSNQRVEAGSLVYMFTKWATCGGDIKSVRILD